MRRNVPEPGIRFRWTAPVSDSNHGPIGSTGQTPPSCRGRPHCGHAKRPAAVQRGQHRPAPSTTASQSQTPKHEVPEEAGRPPRPRRPVASAHGHGGAGAASAPAERLEPGENDADGALDPAAGRQHRGQGAQPREAAPPAEHQGQPRLAGDLSAVCRLEGGKKSSKSD